MANIQIKQHIPIFISSTYEDLIPYREEVQRNLIRLEQIIKGMEYFGTHPENPLSVCLSQVRESKLFIAILGMRFGSVDEESGLSYSQLEYIEARRNNIPTLIYIMDENHPIPSRFVDKGANAEKLVAFKNTLKKKHTVSFFTSPDDLGKKISKDLVDTLSKLEEVSIDSTSMLDVHEENFSEIIEKFILRPSKYQGLEGILSMKVLSRLKGSTLKDDIVTSLGLELGNTISVEVEVLDNNGKSINKEISIYADGQCADWLEQATIGCVIKAHVKTAFCQIRELTSWDEGRYLKNSSYIGLIVTKGISIVQE